MTAMANVGGAGPVPDGASGGAAAGSRAILLIARREILDHLLSLRFHICLVMMLALTALSVYVMYRDYQVRMENHSVLASRATPREGDVDVMAVIPPRPLSVFARGLDELMHRGYTITAFQGIRPATRQTQARSLFHLFPPPDLLYIVKVLMSLIAVLFAYDAVAGEKERGTLRLLLSGPVSRGQAAAGKVLGGLAAVYVPFLPALGLAIVPLTMTGALPLESEDWARLALMVFAALLYVSFFLALGLLVSTLSRRCATSLVVLLFLWAVIVFAVPNIASLTARQLSPLPATETQQLATMHAFARNRFLAHKGEMGSDTGAGAFNEAYDRQVEQYRARLDAQVRVSKAISRLSPAASLSYLMTDLSGTGHIDQRALSLQLMEYKSRNLDALVSQSYGKGGVPPAFQFGRASLHDLAARGTIADFALLALSAAGLFAAAILAFVRTDPR